MKAILEFELPVDKYDHEDALKGSEWRMAMCELAGYLRNQVKHEDHTLEEYRTFERVHQRLFEILQDRDLRLYT